MKLEARLHRLLRAYIVAGILFMLLPGTFLGVWNLISISSEHSVSTLSPSWIQAHGHAQIFGWIGTFIIGIGYFSLSKMGAVSPAAVRRGWMSWGLWTGGVALRWMTNVTLWNWRVLLPISAAAELAAFLIFFRTVRGHKSTGVKPRMEAWMVVVIASTAGFLLTLAWNAALVAYLAVSGDSPAFPHGLDQRFLVIATWGFPVLTVWGFNARWLPAFVGLKPPSEKGLRLALMIALAGIAADLLGSFRVGSALLIIASVTIVAALNMFERSEQRVSLQGVHPAFPALIRTCYVWLLISAVLSMWAATSDQSGGIWGASRHALTVGFLAGMIFAIGPRILPMFAGQKQLFSTAVMLAASLLLNVGCLLRVASEIPAYEGFWRAAWNVLPYSAVLELAAVTLFALNLALTMLRPVRTVRPRHKVGSHRISALPAR